MTIPDSLERLGSFVFAFCFKIVPSNINVSNPGYNEDQTLEVVTHLFSQQNQKINYDDWSALID